LLEAQAPEKAAAVLPVFVTVDPERDTVEALAGYAEHFHPRLMALTGTEEQVAGAAKASRILSQEGGVASASDYRMGHPSLLYLMGPDGGYRTPFTRAGTAEDIAKGLAERVDPAKAVAPPLGS